MTQVEPSRNNRDDVRVQSDGFKFFLTDKKSQRPVQQAKVKSAEIRARPVGHLLLAFGAVLLLGVLGLTKGGFISPLVLILKQSFGIGRFFCGNFGLCRGRIPFTVAQKPGPGCEDWQSHHA